LTCRLSALLFLWSASASAHAISMSTGFATVTGNRVEYLVRMPEYEMTHVRDPEHALFRHLKFTSGFESGRITGQECHHDPATSNFICAANYEFTQPVDRLGVECSFYEITVPNHIHMLHAERDGKSDQAILDSSFPSATLGFRPPTAAELAAAQSGAGAMRVWTNPVQLLLLIALALAARTRPELLRIGLAFATGECVGTIAILRSGWQPSPRFAEAAAALALAYLALEIIAFPKSTGRWLLALVFGGFSAMYFAVFIADSGYRAPWVLAGAAFAGLSVLTAAALIGFGCSKLPWPVSLRPALAKIPAAGLFLTGAVWFALRLRG
jgi:hypothetical protein